MRQDPFERVQTLLFETRVNPLVLLLDLATVLPESLLQRAISLARNASGDEVRAFLLRALAKRLPSLPETKEAKRLMARLSEQQRYEVFERLIITAESGMGAATDLDRSTGVLVATRKKGGGPLQGKSAKARSVKRSKPDRSTREVTRTGTSVETRAARIGGSAKRSKPKPAPMPMPLPPEPLAEAAGDGLEAIEPPDNMGGGTGEPAAIEPIDSGLEAIDDGFEAMPSAVEPATTAVTEEPAGRRDIVNLGFARHDAADKRLDDEPLQRGHSYYFYVNIGYALKEAIGAPTPIDLKKLPEEAVLTVAIFGFEKELEITRGKDVGELKVQKDSTVKVLRQPLEKKSIKLSTDAPAGYLDDFLVFPVKVPEKEGTYRLRCNIYCSQVLVQSHVISANVKSSPAPVADAYSKKLDYVLSQTLRGSHLASLTKEPHLLSLMINDNGDGSHSFRFFGSDGTERIKDDAQVDGPQLSGFLSQARRAMHKVSWDDEDEWNGKAYRYQSQTFDRQKLGNDLALLARAGYRIYDGFITLLTTSAPELNAVMSNTGLVQIALKMSPRAVLPAAVVYDYHWKPEQFDFKTTKFQLCPTFSDAIDKARAGGPPLEECDCFKGGCALKAMIADIRKPGSTKTLLDLPPIICPSGFWGYRHLLGLPLTLDGANKDVPPVIEFDDAVQMIACVSTDPLFVVRDPHLERLKKLKNELKFDRDEGYGAIFSRLKTTIPHVLYFYCHGGIKADSNLPYLEVGQKDQIMPPDLMGEGIVWKDPNPLVFINGCHTTSLNPEVTLDFVSSFVQKSGAAGVIGTEITIFEPLAAKFAEECLSRFLGAPPHNERMPIGKAVRGARLELLKQGNPLGLVYIPYAVASLCLQEAQDN